MYLVWYSLGFLDLGDYLLSYFREFFSYCLLKYFLMAFLFVFFWDIMLGHSTHLHLKVILDKYDPIAIYFVVLGLSLYTFSVFPV